MRPIDADEVKLPKGFFENVTTVPRFYGWLDTIPTIDAVPVVRCKDCRYYWKNHTDDRSVPVCLASPSDDAFCSEGERKNYAVD